MALPPQAVIADSLMFVERPLLSQPLSCLLMMMTISCALMRLILGLLFFSMGLNDWNRIVLLRDMV